MGARTVEEVAAALVAFVNAELMAPGHLLSPVDRFDAAGIDSMALLKILLFVERQYGFWVPDEDLVEPHISSAVELARYICCHGG